jgi:hypothetical protein
MDLKQHWMKVQEDLVVDRTGPSIEENNATTLGVLTGTVGNWSHWCFEQCGRWGC